jgi:hypothetical protein
MEECAEDVPVGKGWEESLRQGLQAALIASPFWPGMNSRQILKQSFSAACESRIDSKAFTPEMNSRQILVPRFSASCDAVLFESHLKRGFRWCEMRVLGLLGGAVWRGRRGVFGCTFGMFEKLSSIRVSGIGGMWLILNGLADSI